MKPIHLSVDNYKGKVIIPTCAKTAAGFYMEIEPVEIVSAAEVPAIAAAIKRAISRGNPVIPTPSPDAYPKPVVLQHAGARTWSAYEKHVRSWYVDIKMERFEITPLRPRADRGFEEDLENRQTFSVELGIDGLVRRAAEVVSSV